MATYSIDLTNATANGYFTAKAAAGVFMPEAHYDEIEENKPKIVATVTDSGKSFTAANSTDAFNVGTATGSVKDATLGDRADTVAAEAVAAGSTWNLGAGNDNIAITVSGVTVDAGEGSDSIKIGADNAKITLGDGKDTVSLGTGKGISLTDYDYTQDVIQAPGVAATGFTSVTSEGAVSLTATTEIQLGTTTDSGFYALRLDDGTGSDSLYAWGGENEATIDLSSAKVAASIKGASNEKSDTITGTRYDDTIIAGKGDVVNASRGADSILVSGESVVIGLESGLAETDTVTGAQTGFDETDTALSVADGSVLKTAKVASDKITLGMGRSSVALTFASGTPDSLDVKVDVGGTVVNAQLLTGDEGTIDEGATYIWGTTGAGKLGVAANDTVSVIDLSNSGNYGDTRYYAGVTSANAAASSNDIVLVGNADAATTLTGGTANSTLIGSGAKADVLNGGSGNDTFYFGAGYGNDTIKGYYYDDSAHGQDALHFTGLVSGIKRDSKKVSLTFGTDTLAIEKPREFVDENIRFTTDVDDTTSIAKVGITNQKNTFTYDEDTTLYIGGTKGDKITVGASDNASIFLTNTEGVLYSGITEVDGSASSGNVIIAGTAANETLRAGTGYSSLNGGAGNDALYGTSKGETTYWFGAGSGKDTIFSSSESDKVYLYGYDLSTLDGNNFKYGTDLTLAFTDGSSILVKDVKNGVKTFVLSDGSEWTYNTDTKKFTVKE